MDINQAAQPWMILKPCIHILLPKMDDRNRRGVNRNITMSVNGAIATDDLFIGRVSDLEI